MNKEKTPIERLFNIEYIDKSDLVEIENFINKYSEQVVDINKKCIEVKSNVDFLLKKIENVEQLILVLTRKVDDMNQQMTSVNNMVSPGMFNPSQYIQNNNFTRQQSQYNNPAQQPRQQMQDQRLGFDPMSVSVPNQEGVVQVMTPQQQAELIKRQRLTQQRS